MWPPTSSLGAVGFVYRPSRMEVDSEDGSRLSAAVLSSLLTLDVSPGLREELVQLLRVQTAALRRRRLREQQERDRRRRQYLRRRRAFILSSITAVLSLITSTSRHIWVRNRSPAHTFWSLADSFDDVEWKM